MAIEDDILFFEQAPLLRLLGRTALRILALGARSHDVPYGGLLFAKGDIADCGYLIQRGSFVIGESNFSAEIVGPGTLLGEMSMIAEGVRGASATAREDSVGEVDSAQLVSAYVGQLSRCRRAAARAYWCADRAIGSGLVEGARHPDAGRSALSFSSKHDLIRKPVPTFRDHAASIVAVTGTWSEGCAQPRASLAILIPESRSASAGAIQK